MKKAILFLLIVPPYFLIAQLTNVEKNALDVYIDGLIKKGDPGGAVGIVQNGEVVYERYFGLASLEYGIPISASSVFNIASVAKQFTALCVLKLAYENKLSLDEDFRNYVPEFLPEVKDTIWIRHLINHSSGIRDLYDLLGVQGDTWWKKVGFGNQKALDFLRNQRELNFRPGSDWMYSNSNYLLLTAVVEKASGQSFHDYSKELFEEFGMNSTYFIKRYMNVIPNQAMPYSDWGNGIWQKYPMVTKLYGDGFLFTTLSDQLAYEKLLQETSSGFLELSQEAIEEAEITDYGFGLKFRSTLGRRSVRHDGSTGSYLAQTLRFPEQNLSIFVMSNNNRLWSGSIAEKVASIILPPKERTGEAKGSLGEKYLEEVEISRLGGEYKSPSNRVIRILTNNEKLYWRRDNNNPIELIKVAGTLYHMAYDADIKVGFDSNGLKVFTPEEEPIFYQLMPPFNPTKEYLSDLVGTYYNEEISVQFTISFVDDLKLEFQQEGDNHKSKFEVIQRDAFLAEGYLLKPSRDEVGLITGLLMTFRRLENMRFRKMDPKNK